MSKEYKGCDGDKYEIDYGLYYDKCFSIKDLENAWSICYGEKLPEKYDGFIKELDKEASTLEVSGKWTQTEDFDITIEGARYQDKYKVENIIRENLVDLFDTGLICPACYQLPITDVLDSLFYNDIDEEYAKIKKDIGNLNEITITVCSDNNEIKDAEIDSVH